MDVPIAEITHIGELQKTKKGLEMVKVTMKTPTNPKAEYIIYRGQSKNFDLIRKIEMDVFKVGTQVSFSYNKAKEDWQFDNIWKMKRSERRD